MASHPGSLAKNKIFRFLDTAGDGTGVKDASVNGSVTPVVFKIQPAVGEAFNLYRLMMHITGSSPISSDEYGSITSLDNGTTIAIHSTSDDSVIVDITDGMPIKANSEWSRYCYDIGPDAFSAGSDYARARWSFDRAGGPITLTEDEYLAITINDDLTAVGTHHFQVQGERVR